MPAGASSPRLADAHPAARASAAPPRRRAVAAGRKRGGMVPPAGGSRRRPRRATGRTGRSALRGHHGRRADRDGGVGGGRCGIARGGGRRRHPRAHHPFEVCTAVPETGGDLSIRGAMPPAEVSRQPRRSSSLTGATRRVSARHCKTRVAAVRRVDRADRLRERAISMPPVTPAWWNARRWAGRSRPVAPTHAPVHAATTRASARTTPRPKLIS